jgi:putative endopeptidase
MPGVELFIPQKERHSLMAKVIAAVLILVLCLAAAGCTAPGTAGTKPVSTAVHSPDNGFVLNESIRPGDDFFSHVNDDWIRSHPIPDDKSGYTTFDALGDKVDLDLLALYLKAENATAGNTDRNTTLLGQFFRSGMDTEAINKAGLTGLSEDLSMIDRIQSRSELSNATITLLRHGPGWTGTGPVYYYYAEVNPRNSSEMVPGLIEGGLGLPDRDYYLRTDNESRELQEAYKKHIVTVLVLSGEPAETAAAHAETVYAMEKTLAAAHLTNVENRNPEKTTNLYTPDELEAQYPAIGWKTLFAIPGSGPVTKVNVHQPQYVKALNTQLETAPLDDWKVFLRYRLIDNSARYISQPFEEENFAFYSTTLYGTKEMKPRWKRVVWTGDDYLGNLVGKAYVAEYVDPRTRGMVSEMFSTIRQTMDLRIENLSWMNTSTKKAAREKLAVMREKLGYPDTWRDYSGLVLSDSYIGNVRSAYAYDLIHGPSGLETIGKPVDRSVWYMPPQTVNAFYDPTLNEMIFPAAILQSPVFDPDADAAVNYGSLGFFIGHEMTHGFDDQGRRFDKDGNLKDWWTKEDAQNFRNRTQLIVDEYNRFEVLPGLFINGDLTLGENIADFGGTTLAYHAWKSVEKPSPGTSVSGTAADRQFFYAAARNWQGTFREDLSRTLVYTDPHSEIKYRVNGALFNVPEFYDAFPEILPGDALYRNVSMRPVIW